MKTAGLLATRRSLVDRLANWDDQRRWQDFFDTYWKLIYSAAQKSGLTDSEAQEVVQETVITVARRARSATARPVTTPIIPATMPCCRCTRCLARQARCRPAITCSTSM